MKRPITTYTFNPGAGTLDLSAISGFDVRRLFGVIHLPTGALIYAPTPAATYLSIAGAVLHLKVPVAAFSGSDPLLVLYDDGGKPAEDTSLQAIVTALATPAQDGTDAFGVTAPAGGAGIRGWLSGIYAALKGTLKTAPQANAPRVSTTAPLAAQGATFTLAVDGMATGVAQISGTWAGTIAWSGSIDGGATYFAMNVTPFGEGGGASVGSVSANGQWEFSVAGLTHVQATMTAFTSGSASVLLAASSGGKIARVKAPASDPLPTAFASGVAIEGGVVESVSGLNLLSTILPSARLGFWFFQNQAAVALTVVLDDGAGNGMSVFTMSSGGVAGQQGASMGSADTGPHLGRIRVYGPANSQHALRVQ